jgi:zinc transporter ZupT
MNSPQSRNQLRGACAILTAPRLARGRRLAICTHSQRVTVPLGVCAASRESRLFRTGTMVALGLAIHTFPEGMVVFLSALESMSLGLVVTAAIAIHSVPEGIAVEEPVYHATRSKARAVGLARAATCVLTPAPQGPARRQLAAPVRPPDATK